MTTRLQQEIWALQRCSGCGLCVATCSKGMLYWGKEQHPLLQEREKVIGLSHLKLRSCEVCQRFCELTCPRLVDRMPMETRTVVSARSVGTVQGDPANDVARALLVAGRSAGLIDGVIIPSVDPWTLQPVVRIASSAEEIASSMSMQYLWVPTLSALNETIFERGLRRLAVVGTPCVAEAVRRLLGAGNERLWPYQQAIRLTIALFCTGIYMPEVVGELLEQGMGIPRHQIRMLTTSAANGQLTVSLWDGTERQIPLTAVEPFTRQGCGRCDDYLGESADIAVGVLGAVPGYATLITRTSVGDLFLQNARSFGVLETVAQVDTAALTAAKDEKDRRKRAQAFDNLRILMLDALSDPKKQVEVRKVFANLYCASPKSVSNSKKEGCHVTCGEC